MKGPSESLPEPARVVLEGVRRVGFGVLEQGRDVESCPFPSCLSACLEYMGEDYGYTSTVVDSVAWQENNTYIYIMGTSGAAFQLSWRPGWHLDNVAIMYMSDDPDAPFQRAFEAVGYAYEIVSREKERDNEAYFRQRIVESIRDKGRPVLGFGVVGPPECCIITGYDEHGDVLVGWSFFQDLPGFNTGGEFEPSGCFRKRDWFKDTERIILVGEKQEMSPSREIYRQALEWALKVVRTPRITAYGHERHNGLAAYTAWAEALRDDEEFATGDRATLRERYMVHNDAVGTVAEGRWYAAWFLKQVAQGQPAMREHLLAAAMCYQSESDLMWKAWNLTGGTGFSDEQVNKLAKPDVRRQIVPIILHARNNDARAAEHIERALAR